MIAVKRRQYFVDAKVQGALVLRCVIYWLSCVTAMILLWLGWRIMTMPVQASFLDYYPLRELSAQFAPAVITSMILLPFVVIDTIRVSNRFAGPIYRLRRTMREAARGESVEPIHFRGDDFWQSLADDFNSLVKQIEQQKENGGSSEERDAVGAAPESFPS
jgi:hypothetical protein